MGEGAMFTWLKSALLEKWVGRAIIMGLTYLSAWMSQIGIPEAVAAGWVEATGELLKVILPLLIAWLLGMARQKIALNAMPPNVTKYS